MNGSGMEDRTRDQIRAAIVAAYSDLESQGVVPSTRRLYPLIRCRWTTFRDVRDGLIARGLLRSMAKGPVEPDVDPDDDGETMQPDDDDAAEVEARIEAARAVKRREGEPSFVETMRTRCVLPAQRVRSRQALTL